MDSYALKQAFCTASEVCMRYQLNIPKVGRHEAKERQVQNWTARRPGPEDHGTTGPGTRAPRHQRTRGPENQATRATPFKEQKAEPRLKKNLAPPNQGPIWSVSKSMSCGAGIIRGCWCEGEGSKAKSVSGDQPKVKKWT